ncbi:hypothetical protein DRQ53_11835 [bacterium]|nr:MAG: hypothetical protein DRQ53_11835 [bacterium]
MMGTEELVDVLGENEVGGPSREGSVGFRRMAVSLLLAGSLAVGSLAVGLAAMTAGARYGWAERSADSPVLFLGVAGAVALWAVILATPLVVIFSAPFAVAARYLLHRGDRSLVSYVMLGGVTGVAAHGFGAPHLATCVIVGVVFGGTFRGLLVSAERRRLARLSWCDDALGDDFDSTESASHAVKAKRLSMAVMLLVALCLPPIRLMRAWLPWGATFTPYLSSSHLETIESPDGARVLEAHVVDFGAMHTGHALTYIVESDWLTGKRATSMGYLGGMDVFQNKHVPIEWDDDGRYKVDFLAHHRGTERAPPEWH